MIPLALGALIAKVATVAAIPRAVQALKTFFSGPKTREGNSIPQKRPQPEAPSAIPESGTKEVVFTYNALNQRTTPGTNLYDPKGQTTTKDTRTFEWDDDGRMTAIVDGTHRSEFGFDGYGRRIKIAEFDNGVITSKKLYWWLGGEIVTEREGLTAGFPVTKQYFGQGVIANGVKLFYTFDQLGSVRELIDSTGAVRADYRYSTYGERTKESGDLDSDFGYAGLFHHGPSGLDLATYRTYDSAQGRWISRDPLGEGVGPNLYAYCNNNPISGVDPAGLRSQPFDLPGGFYWFDDGGINGYRDYDPTNFASSEEDCPTFDYTLPGFNLNFGPIQFRFKLHFDWIPFRIGHVDDDNGRQHRRRRKINYDRVETLKHRGREQTPFQTDIEQWRILRLIDPNTWVEYGLYKWLVFASNSHRAKRGAAPVDGPPISH